jgi:hypothetical protein
MKDNETGLSQLQVISDAGMSTWFRDLFITDFDTQKLGAYDPYSKEYVLSSNNIKIPIVDECLACGVTQEFIFTESKTAFEYCVNVGQLVGDVEIEYNVTSIQPDVEFEISADYNGTPYTTGFTALSGSLTIDKDSNADDVVNVAIETTGAVVIGASIILFDPIFQGLAISLVAGAIVSTLLTLIVVPLIYYITERKKWEK